MARTTVVRLRLTEIDKDCRVPERIFAPDFGKSHVIEFKKGNGTSSKKHVSDFVLIWSTFGVKPAAGGIFLRIRGLEMLNFLYKKYILV